MQEALKNPHYKKIWEKVIMNRHPESESLKEALGRELQEMYCSYIAFDNLYITNKNFDVPYAYGNSISQIIGRPITLFDILSLLHNMNEQNYCFTSDGYGIYYTTEDNNYLHRVRKICNFNTNLLEEQTPETWEKISNLID